MTDREKFEAWFAPKLVEMRDCDGQSELEIAHRKACYWFCWRDALASQQPDKSELVDYLTKASAIVAAWPEWKNKGSDATKFTSQVTGIDPAHVDENLQPGENLKHVGYLFVNLEGAVVYSPSGYGMKGFTCAGKIYGEVNLQQDQGEGWIEWRGGECPVDREAQVDIKFSGAWGGIGRAGSMFWSHDGGDSDIIAYRVVNP